MSHREPTTDADLGKLQHDSFNYFLYEANAANGLVPDKTAPDWPASIAATGLALAAYPVGVERGYVSRAAAVERTLITLRFFWSSRQGPEPDATGYKGFYYHFLDMQTGRRARQCELSTVDSTFLLAGALTARLYFDADTSAEREIRSLADALYRRADWQWAQNGGSTVTHGWTPEGGFLEYRWEGYDEALLLYVLGLGSPTHALPEASYSAWCATYKWERTYGAVEWLRTHFPELKIRVINVVDLMKLQPPSEHPHGLSDKEFDRLFTTDKPIIFAYHGYPPLIHRLTYRRTNHHNLHVRGYKEEGTTTTPFDMVVLNDLDRFHLAADVIDRVPALGARAAYAQQAIRDKLIEHRQYIARHGEDMPEIRNWKWGLGTAAPSPRGRSSGSTRRKRP